MNKKNSSPEPKTGSYRLEAIDHENIDLSDIPELTEEQIKRAKHSDQFFKERGLQFNPDDPIVVSEYQENGSAITYE